MKQPDPGKTFVLTPRSYHRALDWVARTGTPSSPRGIGTSELLGASLLLKNPRDRVFPDRARGMNIAFGVAEWYAFMTGRTDIGFFTQFIKSYSRFTTDGKTLDGNYGTRINFQADIAGLVVYRSQIDAVITKLKSDNDTRQAVIALYDRNDLFGGGGTNTPCTLNLQFLIRNGQLDCIVNMRSSDMVKGLTYDVFSFTMIQEYIAVQLGLPLGFYLHHAGSLHLYDSDRPMLDKLERKHRWPYVMASMPIWEANDWTGLRCLVEGGLDDPAHFDRCLPTLSWSSPAAKTYLTDLALVMHSFVMRKVNPDRSRKAAHFVEDPTLKFVLRNSLRTAGVIGKK